MKRTTGWRRVTIALMLVLGACFAVHAATPVGVEHVRDAITDAQQLHARLQATISPPVSITARERARAERSLRQVAGRLAQATRLAERNPAYAMHRVDVARRELDKIRRRLRLRPEEVQ